MAATKTATASGGREAKPGPATGVELALAAVAVAALGWAYWPTLAETVGRWRDDPQYSHGFLVPAFSAYLLWSRRGLLAGRTGRGRWAGLGLVALGLLLRAVGVAFYVGWFDVVSLPVCLLGLAGAWAGWAGFRWAYPAAGFLVFMAPLPYAAQTALSGRLQSLATAASTYLLVSAGVPAVAEGNIILLANGTRIGVVEACSGLGMLVTFVALSAAIAALLPAESVGGRIVVVLAAAPVAVLVNVLRITVTGFLYQQSQDEWARWVYHDVAGWLMMPIAVALFFALLWGVRQVVVPVAPPRPVGAVGY